VLAQRGFEVRLMAPENAQAAIRRALREWQRAMPGRTVEVSPGLLTIEGPGTPRAAFTTAGGLATGAVLAAIGGAL
jgi:hypothetical protein